MSEEFPKVTNIDQELNEWQLDGLIRENCFLRTYQDDLGKRQKSFEENFVNCFNNLKGAVHSLSEEIKP